MRQLTTLNKKTFQSVTRTENKGMEVTLTYQLECVMSQNTCGRNGHLTKTNNHANQPN